MLARRKRDSYRGLMELHITELDDDVTIVKKRPLTQDECHNPDLAECYCYKEFVRVRFWDNKSPTFELLRREYISDLEGMNVKVEDDGSLNQEDVARRNWNYDVVNSSDEI